MSIYADQTQITPAFTLIFMKHLCKTELLATKLLILILLE